MRLLVCGGRNWSNKSFLYDTLDYAHKNTYVSVVIEGEARGADTLARMWAESRGIPVERYPASWDKYGKAAGAMRNLQMLVEGKPDVVFAFHQNIYASKGTRNMVHQAGVHGIPVIIHDGKKVWTKR